jgi:hypothetical protein
MLTTLLWIGVASVMLITPSSPGWRVLDPLSVWIVIEPPRSHRGASDPGEPRSRSIADRLTGDSPVFFIYATNDVLDIHATYVSLNLIWAFILSRIDIWESIDSILYTLDITAPDKMAAIVIDATIIMPSIIGVLTIAITLQR